MLKNCLNKKYHNGVLDMKSKNEQVDIIRFDTGDDSDYYNDYDVASSSPFLREGELSISLISR